MRKPILSIIAAFNIKTNISDPLHVKFIYGKGQSEIEFYYLGEEEQAKIQFWCNTVLYFFFFFSFLFPQKKP